MSSIKMPHLRTNCFSSIYFFVWWLTVKRATFKCNKIQTLQGKRERENKKGIELRPHPKVTPTSQEEESVEEPKQSKATSGTGKGHWKRVVILNVQYPLTQFFSFSCIILKAKTKQGCKQTYLYKNILD